MRFIRNLLFRPVIGSITPPIKDYIDTNKRAFLFKKGFIKILWRSLKSLIIFQLTNQKKYLLTSIEPKKHKRCLWLYYDVLQIGDALMDLAPRSLLDKLGIQIDLFTHPHIADLFADDQLLNLIESDPKLINPNNYDFVIVTNIKWKALKYKFFYTRHLPWISIYGEFNGPEINRALFSTKRLAELCTQKIYSREQEFHANQKLIFLNDEFVKQHSFKSIALAVGGVDKHRIFSNWNSLIKGLNNIGIKKIILLGGINGIVEANAIQSNQSKIQNYVGKTSLKECRKLIQQATLLIASDSGLMHLAVTTNTPVIGLFNKEIQCNWRLPKHLLKYALQSKSNNLNDIKISSIINIIKKII